ncbi:MAG: tetratricopeptide repeat protein [Streptosporangiales bacterium]|nr:tetratricopeptide repeat protein [Streptosporangiales bacterium]
MERYERARMFFDAEDYITTAGMLADLAAEVPGDLALRLLLARAYYHSAQLGRAERTLRELVAEDPVEVYAHLLLGRTLQRQSRHEEAHTYLRLAAAMSPEAVPA